VQSSNAVYDFQRAIHFNAEHIKKLTSKQFVDYLKYYIESILT